MSMHKGWKKYPISSIPSLIPRARACVYVQAARVFNALAMYTGEESALAAIVISDLQDPKRNLAWAQEVGG